MSVRPKDIDSLDYSDADSLADFICESMFLDKGQHKEFFRTLFDNCSIKSWEEGYGMGFKNGVRHTTLDRDQIEQQSIAEMRKEQGETISLFCDISTLI